MVLQIIRERRWKEVTGVFNFPSTATNASFVLRKYYGSLLRHYEQLYYFKARSWSPVSPGQCTEEPPLFSKLDFGVLYFKTIQFFAVPLQSSLISQCPAQVTVQPSPEYQAAAVKQQTANIAELCRGVSLLKPAAVIFSKVYLGLEYFLNCNLIAGLLKNLSINWIPSRKN